MKFVVATKRHEADLRSLMCSIHMPGRIVLSYHREPNYFYGANIQGKKNLTIVGLIKNKLVGFGCISLKPMYINGSEKMFGYLSGLRSISEVRGGRNLLAAYKHFQNNSGDISSVICSTNFLISSGISGLLVKRFIGFPELFSSISNFVLKTFSITFPGAPQASPKLVG